LRHIGGSWENPGRLCVFVLGGAKIGDAFLMIDTVLSGEIADVVLTGGLVAQVLLWAATATVAGRNEEAGGRGSIQPDSMY